MLVHVGNIKAFGSESVMYGVIMLSDQRELRLVHLLRAVRPPTEGEALRWRWRKQTLSLSLSDLCLDI